MADTTKQYISELKLRGAHYRILAVASMEQVIGAGLSTISGIIIPIIALLHGSSLPVFLQGLLGASGLIGIATGSMILGNLSDRYGYLFYFRLSPALILAGALLIYFIPTLPVLLIGLFVIGFGVGGGYSLDGNYISQLMPIKWRLFMVGVAKATSSIGFFAVAGIAYIILKDNFTPEHWNVLMLIIAALGGLTLLTRIWFRNSPRWLLSHGEYDKAQEAAHFFFGKNVYVKALSTDPKVTSPSYSSFLKGENLKKVIYSGIPWACEGVGVYGVGVFLPILVAALGIAGNSDATGLSHIINSVELTAVINFFILPGFIMGLIAVRKMSHLRMLTGGFFVSAVALAMLFVAYHFKLPVWVSVVSFILFELFLNAGPHLVTFIIPDGIYKVEDRGTGSGIAAMLGKVGAIVGVFLMPMLLKWGGIELVLIVCIAVMVIGAFVGQVFGKMVMKDEAADASINDD